MFADAMQDTREKQEVGPCTVPSVAAVVQGQLQAWQPTLINTLCLKLTRV